MPSSSKQSTSLLSNAKRKLIGNDSEEEEPLLSTSKQNTSLFTNVGRRLIVSDSEEEEEENDEEISHSKGMSNIQQIKVHPKFNFEDF